MKIRLSKLEKFGTAFIHPLAFVEGEVFLGKNSSIWPFAVLRADEGIIRIGKNTSIQDNCVLHGTVKIGSNVTVGHSAVIHNATVGSNVLIGMNSTILNNAKIGSWIIIAAGSLVKPNSALKGGFLYAGVPAEKKRPLTPQDRELIINSYKDYLEKIKERTKQ
ncbi:MAG: gamma carbonic anhydrase family protein [Candidatus Diapherotrites archaeon]